MSRRLAIQLPGLVESGLDQDEEFFYLQHENERRTFRFHDYSEIYKVPGLYEQLFQDRLKCESPSKISQVLKKTLAQACKDMAELRILDLGAGNGVMGEALRNCGISRLVGVDILPEAREAVNRDRPGVYDAYYVLDLCRVDDAQQRDLLSWSLNCLTSVSALGFGDIPPKAFVRAFNLIRDDGWVLFNIRDSFLDRNDRTGFSVTIRELFLAGYLDVYHLERYRHRFSMDGKPLYYFVIAGRKQRDIPRDFLKRLGIEGCVEDGGLSRDEK